MLIRAAPLPPRRAVWLNFPSILIAVVLVVILVNVRFICLAIATFPGAATADDFDTSNRYNKIMAQAARDLAVGWNAQAQVHGAIAAVNITRADGKPLTRATVRASATRPLGQMEAVPLLFGEKSPGRYVAAFPKALPGQWDLHLEISLGERRVHATRRVIAQPAE